DIKYAIIGTAVGLAISACFLALKICMIKKHLFDNDSSDLRSSNLGFNGKGALQALPYTSFISLLQCHHFILDGLFEIEPPPPDHYFPLP
ncbi:CJ128 protein, partial [Crocuta crocuta]